MLICVVICTKMRRRALGPQAGSQAATPNGLSGARTDTESHMAPIWLLWRSIQMGAWCHLVGVNRRNKTPLTTTKCKVSANVADFFAPSPNQRQCSHDTWTLGPRRDPVNSYHNTTCHIISYLCAVVVVRHRFIQFNCEPWVGHMQNYICFVGHKQTFRAPLRVFVKIRETFYACLAPAPLPRAAFVIVAK